MGSIDGYVFTTIATKCNPLLVYIISTINIVLEVINNAEYPCYLLYPKYECTPV